MFRVASKPIEKPMVSDWLNPLAKSGLTLKRNKRKRNRWVLVLRTKTKTHRTFLLVNLTRAVSFLAPSFPQPSFARPSGRAKDSFPQFFNMVFHILEKRGASDG